MTPKTKNQDDNQICECGHNKNAHYYTEDLECMEYVDDGENICPCKKFTPKTKNQDEEIIEKVLKDYLDTFFCNECTKILQKALSLQKKYFRDRIPNVEFQDGYNKAQEETKAKVEKLKKDINEEITETNNNFVRVGLNKARQIINEIFKETSEGGE